MVCSQNVQLSLLDKIDVSQLEKMVSDSESDTKMFAPYDEIAEKLMNYNLDEYINDVNNFGLRSTWDNICRFVIGKNINLPEILDVDNFGELYEMGLALQNKQLKKDSGQYYTPEDISQIMCEWLLKSKEENVCDVGCGTGNLILTYLSLMERKKAVDLILSGKVYLYDSDDIALKICKTIISEKYGYDIAEKINFVHCDFLDRCVKLPENCKVISNPPYASVSDISISWEQTDVIRDTNEYYAAFMEKILNQSVSSVIISPFSFISGGKFYSLRKVMNNLSGFIVSFDNVPGNIFCGRKHGIFNTNTANSVRAAITVSSKEGSSKGYRLSPLIRFKNTERKELLKCETLENFLNPQKQIVSAKNPMFFKCDKRLRNIFEIWNKKSNGSHLADYICENGKYSLSMPNTCRYYTTASPDIMKRSGQLTLNFDKKEVFNFVYCLINSSFVYWHWRIYDGGITYPKNLLLKLPVFLEILTKEDYEFFDKVASEMMEKSKNYVITKNNVGIQENIKFPREYRDKINERLLKILGISEDYRIFDIIHSNMALEVNV